MEYPVLKPTIDNTFVVVHSYEYKDVVIPTGYETNGADIPRVFWSYVPPFKPKYLPAVLVHDYLCSKGLYGKADEYFDEILKSIEDSLKTKVMVLAVMLYSKYVRASKETEDRP